MEGLSRKSIVFFDGHCGLCHGAVRFILDRDRRGRFLFAPLHSPAARTLLGNRALQGDSLLLLEDGRLYQCSTAVLRIARRLGGGWRLVSWLGVIPRPLRDAVYRFVARRRYRWFAAHGFPGGRLAGVHACSLPGVTAPQPFLWDLPCPDHPSGLPSSAPPSGRPPSTDP